MRKFLIAPALALTLATAAGAAFASNDDARVDAPRDQWQTTAQIAELFTTRGYDVRQVKVEKGVLCSKERLLPALIRASRGVSTHYRRPRIPCSSSVCSLR